MEACSHTFILKEVFDHNHSEKMLREIREREENRSHTFELSTNLNHRHYFPSVLDNNDISSYTEYGTYDFSIVPKGDNDHFHNVNIK